MKKTFKRTLTFLFIFVMIFSVNIFAEETKFVYDDANIISSDISNTLNTELNSLSDQTNFGFYILTRSKDTSNDLSTDEYTQNFYNNEIYGNGIDTGIISVMDLFSGEHMFYEFGEENSAFSEKTKEDIFNILSDGYASGDFNKTYSDLALKLSENSSNLNTEESNDGYLYDSSIKSTEYVTDLADLFSPEQEAFLKQRANQIKEKYNFDVVLLTLTDFGGKTPTEFADDYFDYNGFGAGENRDGVLFLQNPVTRDYYTSTRGFGEVAFTEYGVSELNTQVVEHLKNNDSYGAFCTFLDITENYLQLAKEGTPFDENKMSDFKFYVGVSAIIGLIIAFFRMKFMKNSMKTAEKQLYAREYTKEGSFNLSHKRDSYLYSTTTRTPKPKSSSSGGSHTSSSGASHGGGGGKY